MGGFPCTPEVDQYTYTPWAYPFGVDARYVVRDMLQGIGKEVVMLVENLDTDELFILTGQPVQGATDEPWSNLGEPIPIGDWGTGTVYPNYQRSSYQGGGTVKDVFAVYDNTNGSPYDSAVVVVDVATMDVSTVYLTGLDRNAMDGLVAGPDQFVVTTLEYVSSPQPLENRVVRGYSYDGTLLWTKTFVRYYYGDLANNPYPTDDHAVLAVGAGETWLGRNMPQDDVAFATGVSASSSKVGTARRYTGTVNWSTQPTGQASYFFQWRVYHFNYPGPVDLDVSLTATWGDAYSETFVDEPYYNYRLIRRTYTSRPSNGTFEMVVDDGVGQAYASQFQYGVLVDNSDPYDDYLVVWDGDTKIAQVEPPPGTWQTQSDDGWYVRAEPLPGGESWVVVVSESCGSGAE